MRSICLLEGLWVQILTPASLEQRVKRHFKDSWCNTTCGSCSSLELASEYSLCLFQYQICVNTMAAVVNYSPPWWVNLFHRLPHFNLQFHLTSSDFRPEDSEYQKVGRVQVLLGKTQSTSRSMFARRAATSKDVLEHDVHPLEAFTAVWPLVKVLKVLVGIQNVTYSYGQLRWWLIMNNKHKMCGNLNVIE